MLTERREQIRCSLRGLAEVYRAAMDVLEKTLSMLCEELALDPGSCLPARPSGSGGHGEGRLLIDPDLLTVTYQGRTCFLGGSLAFRLLSYLARRPNAYVTRAELLTEVWEGERSDEAVRSIVKELRRRLRAAGLGELADAVDGGVRGHYALRLPG